jgi:type I restriction enzyme S subunit
MGGTIAPLPFGQQASLCGHQATRSTNHANAGSSGTKLPRTNWQDIARFEVALPPTRLAADFTERTRPLVERIISYIQEFRTRTALRDTLLPKLLSGELRVPLNNPIQ